MAADAVSQQERLLNVVALLLKSRRPVSKAEILEQVDGYADAPSQEARERTFERDKRRLADLGLEVRYVTDSYGQEGYTLDTEQALLPPISLTAEERLILETLVHGTLADAQGEFARHARSALFKLRFDNFDGGDDMAPNATAAAPATEPVAAAPAGGATVVGSATQEATRERATLEVLLDAVTTRRTVEFAYARPSGEAQTRTVDPWGLAFVRGAWYLAGLAHERGEERIFKVMRILGKPKRKRPNSRGGEYERPADYDVADTVRRLLQPRDPEGQLDEVSLRVAPDIAFMIREWAEFGASAAATAAGGQPSDAAAGFATFQAEPDGGGILTLRAPMERTVWHIYANYAPYIEVRAPVEVRDTFAARLHAMKQRLADA